jgi:uncharacterized protein
VSRHADVDIEALQVACRVFVEQSAPADAAHDIQHVMRVVRNTVQLTESERGNSLVTLPAAWLHDCVAVAKDSPLRKEGSRLAAQAAVDFLSGRNYPQHLLGEVHHAIEAHSYSAAIPTRSLEAEIVQDADRLDSLGATGIARCLMVGGKLDRPLHGTTDPFCDEREPDDGQFTIDHFYAKLFRLPEMMKTRSGKREAIRRARLMEEYLDNLRQEILLESP